MVSTSYYYDQKMKDLLKEKPIKKKVKKSSRIKNDMNVSQLLKKDAEISHAYGGFVGTGLYSHGKKTRQKLNDIGWAIRNKR